LAAEDLFRQAMLELGPGLSVLVIDLSELEFIDSIGVTLVLEQERRAEDAGCRFSVYLGDGPTRRVFGLLGLDGGLIRETRPGRTPSE
jgi:anti-anti-sigma regulatory factor